MLKRLQIVLCCSFLSSIFIFSSCSSIKNYKYFEDIPDSLTTTKLSTTKYGEPKIQTDDILYIVLQTVDPSAGNTINTLNAQTGGGNLVNNNLSPNGTSFNQGATYGYLVDSFGDVTLPILGAVKVKGLTTQSARLLLEERAKKYYKDPSVIVRFANFKISVLGEVQKPGTYTIPNERISVLDALGYAGDLTIYGKRDNILLLRRDNNGETVAVRFNLNKSQTFQSPYFYLQQNDQIYVEPNKAKINNSDGTQIRNISIASALLSVIVVVISRF